MAGLANSVGETFLAHEAGHVYMFKVLAIEDTLDGVKLYRDKTLNYDMQFAPATVNTEGKTRIKMFWYVKD